MSWQPIETAPRDGTVIDLWAICHLKWDKAGERIVNRKWGPEINWMGIEREGWGISENYEATHWMPRPTPPEDSK